MAAHSEIHDAIVVGAGPAGLTAAIYLGRFRRSCVVLEDGHSRARWIPTSHNIPGFKAGIGGDAFLSSLKAQALDFGARVRRAHVASLTLSDGVFAVGTEEETLRARYVLLATGVRDHLPAVEGAAEAVMRGLLRICPICDAYEAIDQRIAVISDGALGEREAAFLSHYSTRITLLRMGPPNSARNVGSAGSAEFVGSDGSSRSNGSDGIERVSIQPSDLRIEESHVELSTPNGGRCFDVVYLALGCSSQHQLARSLRASCDAQGALIVNAHQETTVTGLYAAGDVVRGLNQLVVAAAESAIAATDIHNKLRDLSRTFRRSLPSPWQRSDGIRM